MTDVATSLGATILSTDQFEFIRVSEGIPAEGRELTPDQNPLEARLADHVSFTKGCYIGQEVIARLDTYKKLKQMLTRFRMTGPTAGQPISGPVYSAASGKPVGRVTSTASATGDAAARGGSQVALGYLDVGVEEIMLKLRPETGSESTIEVVPWEQA